MFTHRFGSLITATTWTVLAQTDSRLRSVGVEVGVRVGVGVAVATIFGSVGDPLQPAGRRGHGMADTPEN
jgi:hypothetical protein